MLFSWNTWLAWKNNIAPRFSSTFGKMWMQFCKNFVLKELNMAIPNTPENSGCCFTNKKTINEQLTGLILCAITKKKLASKVGLLALMATKEARFS